MSAVDISAGYPVHAVAEYREWTNPHGARFTDWKAACGANGTESGHSALKTAVSARKAELCPSCWPAGHATPHEHPKRLETAE